MIRVVAPSRLHFGLFCLPSAQWDPQCWDTSEERILLARHFGGVGLMVRDPGLRLNISPAPTWTASGPHAERALEIARTFNDRLPCHIDIENDAAPEHVGLGTGTQLAMALAWGLSQLAGITEPDAVELAQKSGRGKRSGIGLHGFLQGGFLVEGGKGPNTSISPLLVREPFPEEWKVLLIVPRRSRGLAGMAEREAFAQLPATPIETTDTLARLVLLGMLPSLKERDLVNFGEALHDFNRRVGMLFYPVQGGIYSHPLTSEIVAYCRRLSVNGVGQSSWGPAIFAIVWEDRAEELRRGLLKRFSLEEDEVAITSAF